MSSTKPSSTVSGRLHRGHVRAIATVKTLVRLKVPRIALGASDVIGNLSSSLTVLDSRRAEIARIASAESDETMRTNADRRSDRSDGTERAVA